MKLLTVPEAAKILGVKEKTLRDWIWKKKIETVRSGSRYVRISEVAVQNFIDSHTVPMKSAEIVRKGATSATFSGTLQQA